MWAAIRVIVVQWLLARIGLRWLLSLALIGGIAVLVFVGLPTLLVIGAFAFLLWRWLRRSEPSPAPSSDQA
jgi:hypothetical protein